MKYEKITPAQFALRLKAGKYKTRTGARRAIAKMRTWSEKDKAVARNAVSRHFAVTVKSLVRRERVKRRQAAAKLFPWRVSVEYTGHHGLYDDLLRKIAKGYPSEGSGFMFMSGRRDMAWLCKTEEQARKLGEQFVGLPGIVGVHISGNLIEESQLGIAKLKSRSARIVSHDWKRARKVKPKKKPGKKPRKKSGSKP